MSNTLQIGPLTFPFQLLLVFAAVALALFVANFLGRKAGVDADTPLFRLLLLALLAARLGFVIEYREIYFATPLDMLDMLDIRDGGWQPIAGVAAAWVGALVLGWRRPSIRRPVVSALAAATLVWGLGTAALAWQPAPTTQLPSISLTSVEGRPVALSAFAGAPMVVNLWATWCPPCQREMPVMAKAQADHPGIHFVFLNQGESQAKVQAYLTAHKLGLRNVLLDTQGQAGVHFSQQALPATLFFDAQGRLVDTRIGELSHATLSQRLQALASP